jgi:hypothetical protein
LEIIKRLKGLMITKSRRLNAEDYYLRFGAGVPNWGHAEN